MPFRKKQVSRKKRVYSKKKQMATKAYVSRALSKNIEHKFFDKTVTAATGGTLTTGMVFTDLSAITQATTDSARIGDRCKITSFWCRMLCDCSTTSAQNWRVCIIRWKDSSLKNPIAVSQVFQNTTAGGLGIMSPFNHDYRKFFTVVKDWYFSIEPISVGGNRFEKTLQFSKNFKNVAIQYEAASTDGQGKFYLAVGVDANPAVAASYNFYSRLMYTDA